MVPQMKKNGEKYDIGRQKAMYDFRYDFVKRAVSSLEVLVVCLLSMDLSCDEHHG